MAKKRSEIAALASKTINSVEKGSCMGAMLNYAKMHQAIGVAESQGDFVPMTIVKEASYSFNESCVRSSPRKR